MSALNADGGFEINTTTCARSLSRMRTLIGFETSHVATSWVGWLVYWIAAARRTAATRRMESLLTGASYRVPLLVGICLLVFSGRPLLGFDLRLLPQARLVAGIGAALTMAG